MKNKITKLFGTNYFPFLFIYQQKKTRANIIPRLEEYEEIGISFDGNMLIEYNGVFNLPSELVPYACRYNICTTAKQRKIGIKYSMVTKFTMYQKF